MATKAKLNIIEGNQVGSLIAGNMYFFKYLAEPTNILFDRYPLIFVLRKRGLLLEGINFHYIPILPDWRTPLFEDMKRYFDSDEIADDTRLRVKLFRELILKQRKFRFAKIALHRYKRNHIRSKIIMIPPTEWEKAILQPAERFVTGHLKKLQTRVIHKESLIKGRKRT